MAGSPKRWLFVNWAALSIFLVDWEFPCSLVPSLLAPKSQQRLVSLETSRRP